MTRFRCALVLTSWLLACGKPASSTTQEAVATPSTPASSSPAPEAPAVAREAEPREPPAAKAGEIFYREVMLGGASTDDTVPMLVAIHGLGDAPEGFMHLFNGFPAKARLILPRALDPYEEGYSWFPLRVRDGQPEVLAQGIDHAADLLAEAIAQLQRDKPVQGAPIVTGFSQGGMLTMALAVHHPQVVGAAVPVGGWLPPPLWPKKRPENKTSGAALPPIVALHGAVDNAVPFEPTKEALEHLSRIGFQTQLLSYPGVQHVITEEMRRDLFDHLIDAMRTQEARK